MPDETPNYLALEPLIVARWKAEVPALNDVLSMPDLNNIEDAVRRPPAGIVFWDGDDVITGEGGASSQGASQVIDQRWGLVIAVRNVSDQRGGMGAREEAGPLITKTIRAFAGWQPGVNNCRPLRRASAPGPAFERGFAYFPLLLVARMVIN